MKTYITTLCLILGLGFSTQAQERPGEANTEVIEYIDESSINLTEKQARLLKTIRARPQTKAVTVVKLLNISSIKDNESIEFNLPQGRLINAQKEEVKIHSGDNFTWSGRINDTISTVYINTKGGNAYILLHSKDVRFEIEPLTDGLHALIEIDPTKFESELPPLEVPEEERKKDHERGKKHKSMLLTTPEIDVLVAYTTDAENSTGDINQLINSAEGLSNVSFSNSDVNATINVVHTVEVSYSESGSISTDLNRLRLTNDGHLDNIHSLRNQYGADLVVLLVSSGGAGIGYVDATSSYAFSVVHYSYAQSQYTMAHEIGHNLGCAHNVEDANVWAYPYGFGYRNFSAGWRTLMAYSPPQNRINFWSNPDVDLGGVPMGTVEQEDNP